MANSGRTPRWSGRAILIGGALAGAAAFGTGLAHADDTGSTAVEPVSSSPLYSTLWDQDEQLLQDGNPLDELKTASSDMSEAMAELSKMPHTTVIGGDPATMFAQLEAIQQPLLSSHDTFLSNLGGFLFAVPDQQLEHAGESFLTATQDLAADPSSSAADAALLAATFQYADAALVDSLFPNVVGKLIDQALDLGGPDAGIGDAGSAAADLAGAFDWPL